MSDRPERPTADMRPNSADSARPSPPITNELAGDRDEVMARDEPALTGPAETAPLGDPPPTAAPARDPSYRGLALGLAAILLFTLALVGTAPFWAPLLPWGAQRTGIDPTVVERLDAAQQQIHFLEQQIAAGRGEKNSAKSTSPAASIRSAGALSAPTGRAS